MEYGRARRLEALKRTKKVLERWPPDPGANSRASNQGKLVKRLGGTTPGREDKRRETEKRKQQTSLQEWIKAARKGFGPRKDSEEAI